MIAPSGAAWLALMLGFERLLIASLSGRRPAPGHSSARTRTRRRTPFRFLPTPRKQDLAEAEHRVALCYLAGLGVPASRPRARVGSSAPPAAATLRRKCCSAGLCAAWPRQSCQRGRPRGLRSISSLGRNCRPDFESALKWARQASEAGSPKGQAMLAYRSHPRPRTPARSRRGAYFVRAIRQAGCPEGCLGYALSLAGSDKREKGRPAEVVEFLRHAAEAELPTAIYLLGVLD